ncbi:receptor-like protein EIX1 [Musa acuminata AAA Group]|uniref:receptor-like protein EIX1 n=1 Tax=Musa acuminata AAA Group TaxID=214697 RepID=UPI0031DD13A4
MEHHGHFLSSSCFCSWESSLPPQQQAIPALVAKRTRGQLFSSSSKACSIPAASYLPGRVTTAADGEAFAAETAPAMSSNSDCATPHPHLTATTTSCPARSVLLCSSLRHLSYLDLSRNRFDGASIPRFIGSLTSLRYLNLSDATFGRTIPHQLGNLSRLQYPDFHWLYNPPRPLVVDNFHWISRRSSLSYLDTSAINLSAAGDVYDEVTKLPRLSVLRLINCQLLRLPNTLPPSANLTSLTSLDLSSNYLGPLLLSWLFNISKSQEYRSLLQPVPWPDLWLWEVVFPDGDINMNNLSQIIWVLYSLVGCSTSANLKSIDLSFNQFHGPISGFGKLFSLQVLQLGGNDFNDTASWNIKILCNLQILDLLYNGISVDISNFGKQLSGCVRNRLQVLNLANNALGGGAPVWIGELRNLKSLHLEDNLLSGLIPPSLGTLSSLSFLYLSDNMLRGSISESFGQLSELIVWVVSYNQLSGIVSDVHFSSITRFEALLLS